MNDDLPAGWLRRDCVARALAPDDDAPAPAPAPADDRDNTEPEPEPDAAPDRPDPEPDDLRLVDRLDPLVPEEWADRRDGWDARGLAILADGRAWGLPPVDGAMLAGNPRLGPALRGLAVASESSARLLADLGPPCVDTIAAMLRRLDAVRGAVLNLASLLLVENYDLTDPEAVGLIPPPDSPAFAAMFEAVVVCCSPVLPGPADLTDAEIADAFPD